MVYYKNSEATKSLFKNFVKDVIDAKKSPSWEYYFKNKNGYYQRHSILKLGVTNFDEPFQEVVDIPDKKPPFKIQKRVSEYKLSPEDKVDLYCYYYMQMHYSSSLYVYLIKEAYFRECVFNDEKDILFIDFGCGPFTSGAAFVEFYKALSLPNPLRFFYLGIDKANAMLVKGEKIANGIDELGISSYHFISDNNLILSTLKDFEDSFKQHLNTSVIINLCYLLASKTFEIEEFINKLKNIVKKFKQNSIILIYQNPTSPSNYFHTNWEKLVELLPDWRQLNSCPKDMDFKFDDEVGNWLDEQQPEKTVRFDYLWNNIK